MEDTDDNRRAHLIQIQLVIVRMAANSFLLKGWALTLVAALFALASVDSRQEFALLALLPAIMFWGLDAYYLRQERLFRDLYNGIRAAPLGTLKDTFSMDTSPYESEVRPLWATIYTPTLAAFHGAIVVAVIIGIIVLATQGGGQNANP
jgi:hypothetical protein